jgi:hypothetical protein
VAAKQGLFDAPAAKTTLVLLSKTRAHRARPWLSNKALKLSGRRRSPCRGFEPPAACRGARKRPACVHGGRRAILGGYTGGRQLSARPLDSRNRSPERGESELSERSTSPLPRCTVSHGSRARLRLRQRAERISPVGEASAKQQLFVQPGLCSITRLLSTTPVLSRASVAV